MCVEKMVSICSDVNGSSPDWPGGQNIGLGLDKLALSSSIWPQPGLDLVNSASENVLSNAK